MKKCMMFLLVLTLVFSGIMAGCSPAPEAKTAEANAEKPAQELPKYNLRLTTEVNPENHVFKALEDAAAEINEKTDGHIKITNYPSSQLGDYTATYSQIMTGDIEMGASCTDVSYDSRMNVCMFPYIVTGTEDFNKQYFPGGYLWDVYDDIEKDKGITLLGILNGGPIGIGANDLQYDDFATLTDGKVKKDTLIRIPQMELYKHVIEALGFRTTTIAYADLYPALQSGVADGWIGGSPLTNWDNFRDVIDSLIDIQVMYEIFPVTINTKVFESMPAEYQELLENTYLEMSKRIADERTEQESQAKQKFKDKGVNIIEPTQAELNTLAEKLRAEIWPKLKDLVDPEFLDEVCKEFNVKLD
ncbi:MAG: TRAP transporter substrate-binding protein DctP [Clostridiaceae bacterium]|nr:TRAP transporter substrate-binding protein DctP [Clostridiaceae bacterium]